MRTHRPLSLSSALLLACVTSATAQQWSAELQTGRMRSSLDPAADAAHSIAAGLRFESSDAQFRLVGGVPTSEEQPYWGVLAGAKRFAVRSGSWIAGVDLAAHGYRTHDRTQRTRELSGLFGSTLESVPSLSGHAFNAQALPMVGVELPRMQLHARAGVSHFESNFGEQHRVRTARSADAQLTFTPVSAIALVPAIRYERISDSSHIYAGVTAMSGGTRALIWGGIGQWLDSRTDAIAWSAGATLRLHRRFDLSASVRRDVLDPLFLTTPRTSWNLGMLFRLSHNNPPAPIPASYVNGRATIRLPGSHTKSTPRIAGDFNHWQPQPMRFNDGWWWYDVAIVPGVYNYAFVDERGEWFVPEKYPGRKEDGMGGYVAVLVVQP